MKIALCSIGSRGDIQPFLILGQHLTRQGHEVKVASAKMLAPLARDYDVTFHGFEGDYASMVDDESLKKAVGKNPFTVGKALREKVYPIIGESLETFYEMGLWADVVIYHPKTMIDGIGQGFQHKLIKAYVVPIFTPTRAFANPLFSFLPIPRWLNRASYAMVGFALNSFNSPIKAFRKNHDLPQRANILDTPAMYAVSPSLLTQPADYPKDAHFTGLWTDDAPTQPLDQQITSFLAKNEKTLLLTFGSMPYKSKTDINIFIREILKHFGLNILIVKGWGLKDSVIDEDDRILTIESAPFSTLFPRVDYVIHHGGAGTTACALTAGIPQLITPILHPFGDQYFWGKLIEHNEIGIEPMPLTKLTTKKLVSGLKTLLEPRFAQHAKQMQSSIIQENGLAVATTIIANHYATHKPSQE